MPRRRQVSRRQLVVELPEFSISCIYGPGGVREVVSGNAPAADPIRVFVSTVEPTVVSSSGKKEHNQGPK